MNPFLWERTHKAALIVAAIIGASLGVVLGYIAHGVASGAEGGFSFNYWVRHPLAYGGLWWGLFGAVAAAGLGYAKRLLSN